MSTGNLHTPARARTTGASSPQHPLLISQQRMAAEHGRIARKKKLWNLDAAAVAAARLPLLLMLMEQTASFCRNNNRRANQKGRKGSNAKARDRLCDG